MPLTERGHTMPVSVLFVASNPTAITFDFAGELAVIKEAWQQRSDTTEVLARWSVAVDGLRDDVSRTRPDIVHILSPGVEPVTRAMVMSDEQGRPLYVQPDALAGAFDVRAAAAPALVVLNTCHSRAHAEAIAPYAGCAIAMDGLIYDHAAIAFARELYASLAFGATVAAAFEQARAAVAHVTPAQRDVPCLLPGRLDPADTTFDTQVPRPVAEQATTTAAPKGATRCAKIFCSYSHKDEKYRAELEAHLALLTRRGAVDVWHDRKIRPGQDWAREIDQNLDHANLVLLLISADFVASEYCYGIEMTRALERARAGATHVVPILVRKCDVEGAPFSGLHWLPSGSKPVKNWADRDSAWTDVARGVRKVVEELGPGDMGNAISR